MKNKTTKPAFAAGRYFKYAVGEIALVMIGILLALQVNNWNEQRKLNDQEQYLLKELKSEFSINLKNLNENLILNNNNKEAIFAILEMIQNKSIKRNTDKLDSLFMVVFSYGSFNTTSGVLNEIINSGKLRVIKNDSLRTNLTQWLGKIDNLEEDIIIRRDQMNYQLQPYYSKYAPVRNGNQFMKFNHWSSTYKHKRLKKSNFSYDFNALQSREFEGIVYKYLLDQDFVVLNDIELKKFIETILSQIKNSINNND